MEKQLTKRGDNQLVYPSMNVSEVSREHGVCTPLLNNEIGLDVNYPGTDFVVQITLVRLNGKTLSTPPSKYVSYSPTPKVRGMNA
jgi:hypothetical protein